MNSQTSIRWLITSLGLAVLLGLSATAQTNRVPAVPRQSGGISVPADQPAPRLDENWSVAGLTALRKQVEAAGLALDCVPLPLSSQEIARAEHPEILLGKDPARERALDDICQMIRNAGAAGIPMVKYNLTFLGVVRTPSVTGRGGAVL